MENLRDYHITGKTLKLFANGITERYIRIFIAGQHVYLDHFDLKMHLIYVIWSFKSQSTLS